MSYAEKTGGDSALMQQLVCFRWGNRHFGVPIGQVKETLAIGPVTRVFRTPDFVVGVLNLRGDILTLLDLTQLIGLPSLGTHSSAKILVVQARNKMWGLLVEALTGVQAAPRNKIAEAAPLLGQAPSWITGVLPTPEQQIAILDMELLLESKPLQSLMGQQEPALL